MKKALFPPRIKIPLEVLAAIFIVAVTIYLSRPYHLGRQPTELARQEKLTRLEENEERREEIAQADERFWPAQSYEMAEQTGVRKIEESPALKAIAAKKESLPTSNYQIRIATDNIGVGLVKAQRVIYQNNGNIIKPSEESLATQIASKDIKHTEILFKVPSRNYSQTLSQLREIGKIVVIVPPSKKEKAEDIKEYKLRYPVHEEKPAIVNVQLELTKSETD